MSIFLLLALTLGGSFLYYEYRHAATTIKCREMLARWEKTIASVQKPQCTHDFVVYLDGQEITLTDRNITCIETDVIVNAANKTLPWPAEGVCKAIYEAAGETQLDQWVQENISADRNGVRIKLGQTVATPSFNLSKHGIKHIIHAVGPDARIGEKAEAVYDTYKNSLLLANKLGATSIAFPAISSGIFACDKKEVAEQAVKAISDILPKTQIKKVYLTVTITNNADYYTECKKQLSQQLYLRCHNFCTCSKG